MPRDSPVELKVPLNTNQPFQWPSARHKLYSTRPCGYKADASYIKALYLTATEHHNFLASTKSYGFMTEAVGYEKLALRF